MKYTISVPDFCRGDICQLSLASTDSEHVRFRNVVIKKALSPRDNDLLDREAGVLRSLSLPDPWMHCIPVLYGNTELPDEEGKRVNILSMEAGFFTCEQIISLIPDGLDGRTLVWMWRRLLGLLEWIHGRGYIHGAINPTHVMFFPDNTKRGLADRRRHGIKLIDWSYAVTNGSSQLSAWCPQWREFYPSGIINKSCPVSPWVDVYMGAKLMLYLAQSNEDVPREIIDHFLSCSDQDPRTLGANTTARRFDEFTAIARKAYGEPKFHDFIVPGI